MIQFNDVEQFVFDLFKDSPRCKWNDEANCFIVPHREKTGYIRFYGDNFVELEVYKPNKELPSFYLQFALISKTSARGYFLHFFRYLLDDQDDNENASIVTFKNANKILFTCSCGASSKYFANKIQEMVDPKKESLIFDSCAYTEVENKEKDYDLIVLMPQINYKEKEFIHKFGNKVICANTHDVATRNFHNVLNQILGATN